MLVRIEKEDIAKSHQVVPTRRPICLALWRLTGQSWAYRQGYLYPADQQSRVPVPKDLEVWHNRHLLGDGMYPIEVELDLPQPAGKGARRAWFAGEAVSSGVTPGMTEAPATTSGQDPEGDK